MPPRAKKETQIELGASPPAAEVLTPVVEPVPSGIEYAVGPDVWLCKRFEVLVATLSGLTREQMALLHGALELQTRQWLIARRFFGIQPQTPGRAYPVKELRVWPFTEICADLGITKDDQWQQELNAVRGVWEAVKPKAEARSQKPETEKPRGLFADDALIKKYDFGRVRFKDVDESARFVTRLRDVEKLFIEKATAGMARNLLVTELNMSRLDEEISNKDIMGDDYRANMKLRETMQSGYTKLLESIDALAPWFGAIAGKYSFKGAVAEITEGIRKWEADGDNALLDGIFTALEIQVELRRSVQAPESRYRAGWVVAALEAKANLFHPHYKPTLPLPVLKKLDKAWREAMAAAGQETGEVLTDLDKDGPQGEYPPLVSGN